MYGLYPKNKKYSEEGGTLRRAGHIIRIHLSKDGETSLCGKANSEKFMMVDRPEENKNICVPCLFAEQKVINPIAPKSSVITGEIYNLRTTFGRKRKEYPKYYTRHFLDTNGVPFCKNHMARLSEHAENKLLVEDCEKCLYILEALRYIAETLENHDNNYQR